MYRLLFPLFLLTLGACNEDDIRIELCDHPVPVPCDTSISYIPVTDTCFELPPTPIPGFSTFSDNTSYNGPFYSPFNSDEFGFFSVISTDTEPNSFASIWKIDLCKGERQFILDENIIDNISVPVWGLNDWLVFSKADAALWKIKSSGDSLTKIMDGNFDYPIWLGESNQVFSQLRASSSDYKSVIIDADLGEIVDTLDYVVGVSSYRNNRIATYTAYFGVAEIGYINTDNLNEFISVTELDFSATGVPLDLDWLSDNEIVWIDRVGIHKVDVNTNQVTLIKEICENLTHFFLSTSIEGNEMLLLSRFDIELLGVNDSLGVDNNISILKTNTGEEQIIDLEE